MGAKTFEIMGFRILAAVFAASVFASSSAFAKPATGNNYMERYARQLHSQADNGDLAAAACLGEVYANALPSKTNMAHAIKWYQAAAGNGSFKGKYLLAKAYLWGVGVKQDTAKGLAMLHQLAARGYLPAEETLALAYISGTGVKKDVQKGLRMMRKAARAGNYMAQARMAIYYRHGEGVKMDLEKSRYWLQKAADHTLECFPDYGTLIPFLANANMPPVKGIDTEKSRTIGIAFTYKNRRAVDIALVHSSGIPKLDKAWLKAMHDTLLPPWQESYPMPDKRLTFWVR